MCKSTTSGCPHKTAKAVGLLALRLVIGFIFIYQGYGKLFTGHAGAVGMFTKLGFIGGGEFWAYVVGGLELLGGLMVLLGAYVRFAAVPLAIIMVVAMATVHRAGPLAGSFLPLSLLGGLLALLGTGAGRFRLIQCECCCKACKMMAGACGGAEKEVKEEGGCCGGTCGGSCGGEEEKK